MSKIDIMAQIKNTFSNKNKVSSLLKNKDESSLKFVFGYNNNKPTVNVYDRDKNKILFEAEYEHIGIYNETVSIWYWSWNIPFINKKLYASKNRIKSYPDELIKKFKKYDPFRLEELYFYLTNDNFYCQKKDCDLPAKIALHILDAEGFIKKQKSEDLVEYILIKNINNTY